MALLTVNTISRAGSDFTALAAAVGGSGDTFVSTGVEFVCINNGNGSTCTVTLVYQATFDGQAITNKTVAITTLHIALIGPFPIANYNDGSSLTHISYSVTSSVTIALLKLGS